MWGVRAEKGLGRVQSVDQTEKRAATLEQKLAGRAGRGAGGGWGRETSKGKTEEEERKGERGED